MYKTVRNLTVLGIGLGVSAVVGWLLLKESKREKTPSGLAIRSFTRTPEQEEIPQIVLPLENLEAEATSAPDPSSESLDDLTRIRDVGPRFAEALHAIGINRFAQLAEQIPEELAARLAPQVRVRPQRIRDNDWIGQAARLARS
jgi:predicted flap endonuclease-1-like 5' DNA nuclease